MPRTRRPAATRGLGPCSSTWRHRPSVTHLFWPVLLGYTPIVTHPAIVEAPLSPEAALADIDDLIGRPQVVVAGRGERSWAGFKSGARTVQPRGALVPGATIATSRKFDGISALNPFDASYSTVSNKRTPPA